MLIKKIKVLGLAAFVLMAAACNTTPEKTFSVSGQWTNAKSGYLMLAELPYGMAERLVVDSVHLDSTAAFTLTGPAGQEKVFQVFEKEGPGILIINDQPEIRLMVDSDSLGGFRVTGSPASESIRAFYAEFEPLYESWQIADSANIRLPESALADSVRIAREQAATQARSVLEQHIRASLAAENNGTATWFKLGIARAILPPDIYLLELEKAAARFKGHPGVEWLKIRR